MTDEHLIIFVKNPIPGSVKTRIAQSVGNDKAVTVYRHLLQHTQQLTRMAPWHRTVYYGDFINPNDGWNGYEKYQQTGDDLGQRMYQAFQERFRAGATRVVIIGSDCLEITINHLKDAFKALHTHEVVIGPATDGGYYLLGMSRLLPFVFENKPWSQPELFAKTITDLEEQTISYFLLEQLSDIDEWIDYERYTL